MRGMLRKEGSVFLTVYRKNLLLMAGLYTVLIFVMKNITMLYMLLWMEGFYVLGLDGIDQTSGWERYARTLPVTDRQVVGARMLLGLIVQGTVLLYGGVICAIMALLKFPELQEQLMLIPIFASFSVMMTGAMTPASIKWGVEKTRNVFLLAFVVIMLTLFAVFTRGNINTDALEAGMDAVIPYLSLICVAAAAVVYPVSYLIACRVYRKKEF